jgi:hypothetical protein
MIRKMRAIGMMILIVILVATAVHAEKAYQFELSYIDNTLVYSTTKVTDKQLPQQLIKPDTFSAELIDFSGNSIYTTSFDPPTYGPFTLIAPYRNNAKELTIKNPAQEVILTIPTLQFADTCNNNICEPQESFETCPQDCPSGSDDDYCDGQVDKKCDPDCNNRLDPDCTEATKRGKAQILKSEQRVQEPNEFEEEPRGEPVASAGGVKKGGSTIVKYASIILITVLGGIVIITTAMIRSKRKDGAELVEYARQCLAQGYTIQQITQTLKNTGQTTQKIENIMKKALE